MTKKPNFRRGMTLAEILICVAVVAIAVVMVVSFSVSMGDRTRRSGAQLEAREELELVESLTRSWLNSLLTGGAELAFSAQNSMTEVWGDVLTATGTAPVEGEPAPQYTLRVQYKTLTGTRPGAEDIRVRTERITGMTFFVMQDVNGDALFYCRVTYQVPISGSNQMQQLPHVFCINPHIGE